MTFPRAAATFAAAALAVTALGACGDDSSNDLTVCTNVPFEPFEMREGNEIVGFDADMMQLLADRLDKDLAWVELDFAAIESGAAFNAGRCDIAAAGITINDEREENLGMSDPYFRADQALAVEDGSDIASLDDLDGKKVGVQSASTGEAYAESVAEEYGFEVVKYDDMGTVANSMSAGSIDASIADLFNWEAVAEGNDFAIAEEIATDEYYGFAVDSDDDELLDDANEMIAEALESGEYGEIYEQWIGVEYEGQLDE